ncbi:MAG: iron ABC transporter permease [Deltaproteobacteria bacterium]|nr:iron ABC transporter permease [Deltaproteobacteria bacterium]
MYITPKRFIIINSIFFFILIISVVASLFVGTMPLKIETVLNGKLTVTEKAVLLKLRLPRAITGILVGGSLAIGGVVFQSLLRNPLAEPYILGISSGAATGAIISIILGFSAIPFGLQLSAFLGGLFTIFLVFIISHRENRMNTTILILAGVIINTFFTAVIMFLISITHDERIHHILFWLMGDLSQADFIQIIIVLPIVIFGFFIIFYHFRSLNLINIGEETASQLGVPVEKTKIMLTLVVSLMTGAVVSIAGIIGFIGLIIPHILRIILGGDHRIILPTSFFIGASFLVICDTLSKVITPSTELPVGVITALFGGPFFVYLLRKKRV